MLCWGVEIEQRARVSQLCLHPRDLQWDGISNCMCYSYLGSGLRAITREVYVSSGMSIELIGRGEAWQLEDGGFCVVGNATWYLGNLRLLRCCLKI